MRSPKSLESRISSLIKLIDDRDDFVRSRVREELIRLGEDAIPFLNIATRDENLTLRLAAWPHALRGLCCFSKSEGLFR